MRRISFSFPSPIRLSKRRARGSALIEVSLMAPWLLFLFVGIFDMGFYTYSMISVENAARVAAEYTSASQAAASDQAGACTRVKNELATLANSSKFPSNCSAAPLTVTASYLATGGPDGAPVTSVTVTYQSNQLVPIPGLLMGQLNLTRNVVMRVHP
jgi:Flp pilus assembly protein TadG